MKWPAIVRFDGSDVLELIENQQDWNAFSASLNNDCLLVTCNGDIHELTIRNSELQIKQRSNPMQVDDAISIARRHRAAQAHCCVSKFTATTVAQVIDALVAAEQD